MNEKLLENFKSDDIHLIQCEHKWCDAYGYEKSQMKKDLLDYITNLQQENKELNRMCELYSKSLYNAELTDYKSRCEKTLELLKLPIVYETHQENGERDALLKRIRQAEDTLNGSDNNGTNS